MMREFDSGDLQDARTQVVVKNLPTTLTEHGIRHLFGNVGKVKRVRCGKPLANKERSSALVIYENAKSAEKAVHLFHDFKIGSDGPNLRVFNAKTPEEKLEMRKQRASEEKNLDEIRRMPGFTKEALRLDDFAFEKAGKSEEAKDETQSNAAGSTFDSETLLALKLEMYIVNDNSPSEVVVMEKPVDLSQVALELNLLHFCHKCGKECTYLCCELAAYCSVACQKDDRADHKSDCRVAM